MVFITLVKFLTRYYWEILFWTFLGPKIVVLFLCQWYQCILIDHMNPFIYGFYPFGSICDRLIHIWFLSLWKCPWPVIIEKLYCVPSFLDQNRCFRAPDAIRFDIIACQWYQSILIYHRNQFIYVFLSLW